jgi:hypothetical protein
MLAVKILKRKKKLPFWHVLVLNNSSENLLKPGLLFFWQIIDTTIKNGMNVLDALALIAQTKHLKTN